VIVGPHPSPGLIDQVRGTVLAHRPADAREARCQHLILAGLDHLPHPFDRNAAQTHITASAIVCGKQGTLLHFHKRARAWLQPGGHLEPGEAPWAAALRETCEETGLQVWHPFPEPVLLALDVHSLADHVHFDLRYLLAAEDAPPRPAPHESQAVRWFTWEEALRIAEPHLRTAMRAALEVRAAAVSSKR
jgi:8-oxo-dGTP pyrophosphatase MutT (NUDIX family)